jgi:hypothetical protein
LQPMVKYEDDDGMKLAQDHSFEELDRAFATEANPPSGVPVTMGVANYGIPEGSVIPDEVYQRLKEYFQYWNPETEKYEIELGTNSEWVCTYRELRDDIERSIEGEK